MNTPSPVRVGDAFSIASPLWTTDILPTGRVQTSTVTTDNGHTNTNTNTNARLDRSQALGRPLFTCSLTVSATGGPEPMGRTLDVLFCTDYLPPSNGGVEHVVAELARRLADSGSAVGVFTLAS